MNSILEPVIKPLNIIIDAGCVNRQSFPLLAWEYPGDCWRRRINRTDDVGIKPLTIDETMVNQRSWRGGVERRET